MIDLKRESPNLNASGQILFTSNVAARKPFVAFLHYTRLFVNTGETPSSPVNASPHP